MKHSLALGLLACFFACNPAAHSQELHKIRLWHTYHNAIYEAWETNPKSRIPVYHGKGKIGGKSVHFDMSIQPVARCFGLQCLGLFHVKGQGSGFVPIFVFSQDNADYYIDRIPYASPYPGLTDSIKISRAAIHYYVIGGGFFAPGFEFLYDFHDTPHDENASQPEYVRLLPGVERISTSAGTFVCSHYKLHRLDRDIDVWFNPAVPGGVVKIISKNHDPGGIAFSAVALKKYEDRLRPHMKHLYRLITKGIDNGSIDDWISSKDQGGDPSRLRSPVIGGEFSAELKAVVHSAKRFP